MMRRIIHTMIRPKLKYADVIWSPHKKMHVLKLEKIVAQAMYTTTR